MSFEDRDPLTDPVRIAHEAEKRQWNEFLESTREWERKKEIHSPGIGDMYSLKEIFGGCLLAVVVIVVAALIVNWAILTFVFK